MANGVKCSKEGWVRLTESFLLAAVFLVQNSFFNVIIIKHHPESIFSFLWFLGDFLCLIIFSLAIFVAHHYHRKLKIKEQRSQSRLSYVSPSASNIQANMVNESGISGSLGGASNANHVGSTMTSKTTLNFMFATVSDVTLTSPGKSSGYEASGSSRAGSGNRSPSPHDSEAATEDCAFLTNSRVFGDAKLPMTYMAWMLYGALIIMKITMLFKGNIAQHLNNDDVFGPHTVKLLIGLSTIVFSLLVETHHNAVNDPLRNSYLNNVAFCVAIEILDSVSFLSLLFPTESKLIYPFWLENTVLGLSAVNLLLPAVTIYKLSASNFGRIYNVPLETMYKILHLLLVNAPFLLIRIYLWQFYQMDSAVFLIKNLYAVINFFRGIFPDIKILKQQMQAAKQQKNATPSSTVARIENGGGDADRILDGTPGVTMDNLKSNSAGLIDDNGYVAESDGALRTETDVETDFTNETLYRNQAKFPQSSHTEYPTSSSEAKRQIQALHDRAAKNREVEELKKQKEAEKKSGPSVIERLSKTKSIVVPSSPKEKKPPNNQHQV